MDRRVQRHAVFRARRRRRATRRHLSGRGRRSRQRPSLRRGARGSRPTRAAGQRPAPSPARRPPCLIGTRSSSSRLSTAVVTDVESFRASPTVSGAQVPPALPNLHRCPRAGRRVAERTHPRPATPLPPSRRPGGRPETIRAQVAPLSPSRRPGGPAGRALASPPTPPGSTILNSAQVAAVSARPQVPSTLSGPRGATTLCTRRRLATGAPDCPGACAQRNTYRNWVHPGSSTIPRGIGEPPRSPFIRPSTPAKADRGIVHGTSFAPLLQPIRYWAPELGHPRRPGRAADADDAPFQQFELASRAVRLARWPSPRIRPLPGSIHAA